MADQSNLPVFASIAANIAIATTKFVAAAVTGSAAMLAEGIHSLADSMDGILLLIGQARSRRPPDARRPFGYGRELYFWSFVVALVFFTLGGCFSIYQGVLRVRHPEPLGDPLWAYLVLGVALLFDGASFGIALRNFRKQAKGRGVAEEVVRSKDPTLFTILLEDSADLIGIGLAFLGVYLSHRLGRPELDGIASIGVGLVLMALAVVLLRETKSLLIGESAEPSVLSAIRNVVASNPAVVREQQLRTIHLGPHDVVLALTVELCPELAQGEITQVTAELKSSIRAVAPDVNYIVVEIGSPGSH